MPLEQLRTEGYARACREKASGAPPERRGLRKLLQSLGPGDVVTATRIDRLTRRTLDLFHFVNQILDAGRQFRSLGDTWADTTTPHRRLMPAALGGLAECEADLFRTGTGEGREQVKARGVKISPPRSSPTHRGPRPNDAAPEMRR